MNTYSNTNTTNAPTYDAAGNPTSTTGAYGHRQSNVPLSSFLELSMTRHDRREPSRRQHVVCAWRGHRREESVLSFCRLVLSYIDAVYFPQSLAPKRTRRRRCVSHRSPTARGTGR